MLGQKLIQTLTFGADLFIYLFIYLFNRFYHDYNAKISKTRKEIHLNKSQQRETKVRDTQYRDK